MCNFLSGLVTIERYPRVLCADLLHHEVTVERLKLKPETYREWEWTSEDDRWLEVRAAPGENPNVLKSAIMAKFPTRTACLNECIRQIAAIREHYDYDLGGLTSGEGLTLPQSIGGFLYLGGLTSGEGLTLPQSIGGSLDLGGLTSGEGITWPKDVGDCVYLSALTAKERTELRSKHHLPVK